MADLVVIEEQVKTNPIPTHDHNNINGHKKQLKNPCHVHNGGHEWADCRQNPKNIKTRGKAKIMTKINVEMKAMVDLVKNTDVPKEMNGKPP